jgi:RHS repeat-associated protein
LKDSYVYDENGNVASITDGQENGLTSRTMEYDDLDRLIHVNSAKLWGDAWFTYDALDNLTTSQLTGGATARKLTHTIDPVTNLLTGISNSAGATYSFTLQYDGVGNVKQRGAQSFVFDLGNRLRSAPGKGTYAYDGLGHRVSVVGVDGVNRIQVYSQDGKLLYVKPSNAPTGTRYIHLHNHVIAEATGSSVVYDHTDGLGSPVALTDATGKLISRTRYEPYGLTAAGPTPVIGFTGHVNAADIGLVYMQQRYYDPVAGRFLSIDPVVTDANSGGGFNRYAYANNSPYKYIDPDGRFGVVGALIGAGIEAALQIEMSGHITSTKSIFVAAGVGAVTGGLGSIIGKAAVSGTVTAGRAVLAATAVGGGAGAVGKVVDGAMNGKSASAGEVSVAAAAGAVGGGIGAKIGLSAVAAVERLAARGGVAGHVGATTQAAIQQGGHAVEPAATTGQAAAQRAADVGTSYAEKKINP